MENMETTVIEKKKNKLVRFWQAIWQNRWYTLLLLATVLLLLQIFVFTWTGINGGFFTINSDDLLQYYPYVAQFFEKIKQGTLSFYDINLFCGSSFFSGVYYIPLDIFTFLAFLLSYIFEAETAYSLMNYGRVLCGALILYIAFSRRFNNKTSFICGLILFIGGMTEAYYIFPVYLGICFYAPLGILLVDYCVEKKGSYYLFLTLYSIVVIFYDFYIAYMLLAFLSVYFVVRLHISNTFSFFHKNCFLWNLEFYKRFFEFFFFVLLGVAMSAFFLMPSALYIMKESNRTGQMTIKEIIEQLKNPNPSLESLLYFSKYDNGKYILSNRHYFTQWCNLFVPNEPQSFCLVDAGDYVREHASLYITTGGLIYFAYFFTLKGKEQNRLKFWVVLFNIFLCIPIFSILFGFNSTPYVRWFFIPYLLNLLAAGYAMNENNFQVGHSFLGKIAPLAILTAGLITIIYVLKNDPDIYIHYSKEFPVGFYGILIPALVFVSIYLILLIVFLILEICKVRTRMEGKLIPIFTFLEFILGAVCIFCNVDNTNDYYYYSKDMAKYDKAMLKEYYGYDQKEGYRINLYSWEGRYGTNANISYGNVNFGNFFQSFYNTELNTCMRETFGYSSTSWSRRFNEPYSLLYGPLFNMRYIVVSEYENTTLPEKYYSCAMDVDGRKYYKLKDDIPFIVYDSYYDSDTYFNAFTRPIGQLYSCYYPISEEKENKDIFSLNLKEENGKLLATTINQYVNTVFPTELEEYEDYVVYDLSKIKASSYKDAIYAYSLSSSSRQMMNGFFYATNDLHDSLSEYEGELQFHYSNYYGSLEGYKYLVAEKDKNASSSIRLYLYNYKIYDDFIEKQSIYQNKSFTLDGSTMHITCTMPESEYDHIIKTGYTYSEEWIPTDSRYKAVNVNGGFLGIAVPNDIKDADVTLKFSPAGLETGCKISLAGCIIYILVLSSVITVVIIKKKRVRE